MKLKLLLFSALFLSFSSSFAQLSNGLVAHWDFNGDATDISGNGLNGIVTGASLAPGYLGIPNTAYRFSGPDSMYVTHDNIFIPYDSLMNLNHFSICALIKPTAFSQLHCQGNTILNRGNESENDYYALYFNDNTVDNDCYAYRPDKDVFLADYGQLNYDVYPTTRGYDSSIALNTWYCVVETFDGDTSKIYVDGALEKTIYYPYTLASSTNGIRIGAFYDDSGIWPYPFMGDIDDIRLYNRAITNEEAGQYCDTTKATASRSGTAVTSVKHITDVTVVPNPAHNYTVVRLSEASKAKVSLIDMMGKVVEEKMISGSSLMLSVGNLQAGVYLLRVEIPGQEEITRKISVQ